MSGRLSICATPIGNLEDITLRVLRTLKEVDLIAAEDTRHTRGLLTHFDIHTPLTSYHEHNRYEKAEELIGKLEEGLDIALVTDAGTPGISDPGEVLIAECVARGIEVTSLPGATAVITALTLSGMEIRRFAFEAFLPTKKKEREALLTELKDEPRTVVIYEAPHRLAKTLKELAEALGGERRLSLCRELTKIHETVYRGTLGEAAEQFAGADVKGEIVLVIAPGDPDVRADAKKARWEELTIAEHLETYLAQGMERKEAMRAVAKDRGISKREVYQATLDQER